MMKLLRLALPLAVAAALGGCSLGSLLGGGGKVPPTLLRLTPEATPVSIQRSASAGQAVTVAVPVISKELRTTRIAAQVSPYDVQYLTDIQMIDTPDRLFQDLVAETLRRRTGRVVLDPKTTTLDPGIVVNGELRRFGFDEASSSVVVEYDVALARAGGTAVETRRFTATAPATAVGASVGPALNRAANQVALDVATWIGG
ncbi:ABC transporter [Sphingomonas piscis]|uniref:ABC transporter n=1 Tax=Sphingomonas piscis TaxID=2714943 RepID=A0A6G7YQK9_9SPHN|nr:ABC-type transport auxiliary lipoprotein family protein [Sphingomonas piscis]QIK79022.1 ABC transporter [Sphingomonas piscis]